MRTLEINKLTRGFVSQRAWQILYCLASIIALAVWIIGLAYILALPDALWAWIAMAIYTPALILVYRKLGLPDFIG